jgi:hypothetical protein
MNYTAAVMDFFKPPKWLMNLLLAGLCGIIPLIGPMVIKGWLITGFWGREDARPETFPDFDFDKFGKYLERGLWPFLVTFVASLVLSVVMCVFIVPVFILIGVLTGGHDNSCIGFFVFIMMTVLYLLMGVVMAFVLMPLTLRACITQDFAQSFNFAFLKRFTTLMWKEIVLASVFLVVAAVVLSCVGLLALCIGVWFASVLIYFCMLHLEKQLYAIYLSRGGEPIPVSPKLRDDFLPPAPGVPTV